MHAIRSPRRPLVRAAALVLLALGAAALRPAGVQAQGGGAEYTILVWETPAAIAARTDPAAAEAYWGAFAKYGDELRTAGVLVGGNAVQPGETAATVRLRGGRREVGRGPAGGGTEVLGGYFVIRAPSPEAALEWAARCPAAATGTVEVRPNVPLMAG